jgi:hypothetical protein
VLPTASDVHAWAEAGYELSVAQLTATAEALSQLHTHLVIDDPDEALRDLFGLKQDELQVWESIGVNELDRPSPASMAVSLSDLLRMLADTALELASRPDVAAFAAPAAMPAELGWIVHNVGMAVRGMDQACAIYVGQVNSLSDRTVGTSVAMIVLAIVLEVILVLGVVRRAVMATDREYDELLQTLLGLATDASGRFLTESHKEDSATPISGRKIVKYRLAAIHKRQRLGLMPRPVAVTFSDPWDDDDYDDDVSSCSDDDDDDRALARLARMEQLQLLQQQQQQRDLSSSSSAAKSMDNAETAEPDLPIVAAASPGLARALLVGSYYALLLLLLGLIVGHGYVIIFNIGLTDDRCREVNGASRRSFLGSRIESLAAALELASTAATGISAPAWLSSVDLLRCMLDRSVDALLSVHYGLLNGYHFGWYSLPSGQQWARGPVRESAPLGIDGRVPKGTKWPHELDYCSPLTWSAEAHHAVLNTPASVGRYAPQDSILFGGECLAASFRTSSLLMEKVLQKAHFIFLQGARYEINCVASTSELAEVVSRGGLHNLIIRVTDLARMIAAAPTNLLSQRNREYTQLWYTISKEWKLGLQRSFLLYVEESLAMQNDARFSVAVIFVLAFGVTLLQYVWLGRQIKTLLNDNVERAAIVCRLMNEARWVRGVMRDEAAKLAELMAEQLSDSVDEEFVASDFEDDSYSDLAAYGLDAVQVLPLKPKIVGSVRGWSR